MQSAYKQIEKLGTRYIKTVSDALSLEFSCKTMFRIGVDEFVAFTEKWNYAECSDKLIRVFANIQDVNPDFSISYGIVGNLNVTRLDDLTWQADELMLGFKRDFYTSHNRRIR